MNDIILKIGYTVFYIAPIATCLILYYDLDTKKKRLHLLYFVLSIIGLFLFMGWVRSHY